GLTAGIVTAVVFAVYTQIENHVLNPVVMSKTVRINPLLVFIAVLAGASIGSMIGGIFGGFVAALLAIPTAGALQVLVKEVWQATAPDQPQETTVHATEPEESAVQRGELSLSPPICGRMTVERPGALSRTGASRASVAPVPAQQWFGPHWCTGSADSIYQSMNLIKDGRPDIVIVFGADYVYRMDPRQMIDQLPVAPPGGGLVATAGRRRCRPAAGARGPVDGLNVGLQFLPPLQRALGPAAFGWGPGSWPAACCVLAQNLGVFLGDPVHRQGNHNRDHQHSGGRVASYRAQDRRGDDGAVYPRSAAPPQVPRRGPGLGSVTGRDARHDCPFQPVRPGWRRSY